MAERPMAGGKEKVEELSPTEFLVDVDSDSSSTDDVEIIQLVKLQVVTPMKEKLTT